MKLSWRTELPCWLLLVAMFALPVASWSHVPNRLPVHWSLDFQPNRYGGRFEALLGLPLTSLGLYLVLTFFPRIDPGRTNYASFAGAYLIVRLSLLALLLAIDILMLRAFRVGGMSAAGTIPVLAGTFLMVIGSVLRKLRPNWMIGIRTPWTLSSRRSWARTHEVGSWALMASGALIALSPLVGRPWALPAALGVFGASMLSVAIYSYFPWRDDPEKTPPGGHLPAGV